LPIPTVKNNPFAEKVYTLRSNCRYRDRTTGPVQNILLKKNWSLTPTAFSGLLSWLDQGGNSEGQSYLEIRRRLVAYFDRKNCRAPDELADETMNRVARKLEELGTIETETPAKYCYVIARFVFLEDVRARAKDLQLRGQLLHEGANSPGDPSQDETMQRRMDCLRQCAAKLDETNRQLILRYYFGEEKIKIDNRRALARELGITPNALTIRVCRIREKLEQCVRECADGHETIS
jgi:DNA-directed RNA polymerase specialized sigma24 family protein